MHEALGFLGAQAIQYLLIADRAQGGDSQYLGLPSTKQPGPVSSGQQPHLTLDGTYLSQTSTIDAAVLAEQPPAHFLLDNLVEGVVEFLRRILLAKTLFQFPAEFVQRGAQLLLTAKATQGLPDPPFAPRAHHIQHFFWNLGINELALGLADLLGQALLDLDHTLHGLMA